MQGVWAKQTRRPMKEVMGRGSWRCCLEAVDGGKRGEQFIQAPEGCGPGGIHVLPLEPFVMTYIDARRWAENCGNPFLAV